MIGLAGGLQTESMKTRVTGATIWNCIWIIIFSVPGMYLCLTLIDRARRLSLRMSFITPRNAQAIQTPIALVSTNSLSVNVASALDCGKLRYQADALRPCERRQSCSKVSALFSSARKDPTTCVLT
jgi:hypothetical protein